MADNAITLKGLKALREELEQLKTVGRRDIAARIKTAREWGDLKENSEYHDAKNDQGLLEAKIARLDDRLRSAVAVGAKNEPGIVGFGSRVELKSAKGGKKVNYTVVGATEADVTSGSISAESPLGQALLGAKVGDTITFSAPRGDMRFELLSVS